MTCSRGEGRGQVAGRYHIGSGFCLEPAQYLFRFSIDEHADDDYRFAVTRTDYPTCD